MSSPVEVAPSLSRSGPYGPRPAGARGLPAVGPPPDRRSPLAHRFWAAEVTLYRNPPLLEPSEAERIAVERALWAEEGNGIRFGRPRPWPFGPGGEFPLRGSELASLLPGPAGEGWPIPADTVAPERVVEVGQDERGSPWTIPLAEHEGRHMAVLGETGMGKSSFLVAMARAVSPTYGVIFFDPMGEAANEFLNVLGPRSSGRTLWLSPTNSPLGLNALARPSAGEDPTTSSRRVADLVEALRRVRAGHYVERSFWGPRIEEMLARALTAAVSIDGTLVDAHRLLEEAMEGRRPPSESPSDVRSLYERVHQRPEDAEGARRLLFEFTSNPDLVRLLCSENPGLQARDLVAPGGLTVLSGDAKRVGEATTRRLLATYLALVWGELVARPRPAKTFVVMDEVQWFGHETLGEMLRLGRRFNVHVILGTQSLHVLPDELADAVRTNVADFLLFRGSPDEAREFGRSIPGLLPEDLLALGKGEAVFLEGKGRRVRFVRVRRPPMVRSASSSLIRLATPEPTSAAPGAWARPASLSAGPAPTAPPSRRFYLGDVARNGSSPDHRIRELGGVLGRRGAIVGRGTDRGGAYWDLTEEGFEWVRGQLRRSS